MKKLIKKIPVLYPFARYVKIKYVAPLSFPGSADYWRQRYKAGGTSGAGSYHKLAKFKAEVLNAFVKEHGIRTIIEYGCGDGNQLSLSEYPSYIGFDVSQKAIEICRGIFCNDKTKRFCLMARLSISAPVKRKLAVSSD